MKLSARLQACADLVQPGHVAVDVGTDHGRLPIYLIKNKICPRVLAGDLREKPLDSAKKNGKLYGIGSELSFYLSDGLKQIPRGDFRTVICAGMGGETICDILANARDLWSSEYQFLLQPQSAPYLLREFLSQHGFEILQEVLAQDGKFVYTIMEVRWGETMPLTLGETYRPQGVVDRQAPLYRAYMGRVIDSLTMTVAGLNRGAEVSPEKRLRFETALAELIELEGWK